ncbi:MAG: glycosyltransferase family 2 protein [Bacteroidetes bacterium]|nr:glycosyltransferase family 2 protein [Bacteroidota bacterium]
MLTKLPEENKKDIAVITMARNDDFFLTRWIDYYGKQAGEENLYIFLDGEDQPIPNNAGKVNIKHTKRIAEHVVAAEKRRLGFLSDTAANLLKQYKLVIGVDADEFLVVDPNCGKSLVEYLCSQNIKTSLSGLGIDVGQHLVLEKKLNPRLPFLSQREFALVSSRYTKPSVISKPVRWGSGFHRIRKYNFTIDPNLYLFHFGSVDFQMIQDRFLDKDRMATGRERHIKKRAKTIDLVTKLKAHTGDKWLAIARHIQSFIRPVYAINKPSMAGWKLIIKIPERFKSVV